MGREGGIIFTAREIGNATCHADRFRQHPASANANDGEADEEHGEPEGEGEREREEGVEEEGGRCVSSASVIARDRDAFSRARVRPLACGSMKTSRTGAIPTEGEPNEGEGVTLQSRYTADLVFALSRYARVAVSLFSLPLRGNRLLASLALDSLFLLSSVPSFALFFFSFFFPRRIRPAV
jgi:hypothetical protein